MRGLLTAIAVAFWIGCGAPSTTPPGPRESGKLTSIEPADGLLDLDGRPFDLWHGNDESKATVIVFTRSDCPISNRYAPTVQELYDKYQPRGLRFFLIYVDPQEDAELIRKHLKEFGYPCQALRDPAHSLVAVTGATVTPEAVLFNAQHEQVYRGRIDDWYSTFGQSRDEAMTHELADAIEATLANTPVDKPVTQAVGCAIGDLR